MKSLLAIIALGFVFNAFAEDNAKFEEGQKLLVGEMEKRIALLQTEKSCIEAATNREGLKKCRETAKGEHEKMRADHKEMKGKMIDERMKKLEEKKQELQKK